ncbi:hypothetical protein MICAB_690001 [Microcystis aeruginosa PCC 9717]|uniref:Transposase n=1 Tax=Microcystis aeruginosa PCC 9717 TaxID=1160286 RepID=I4FW54_MICAE|nr:hypothetical protein MICAB_690001 [Microcystis aeruginosa PCC 9717]
MLDEYKAQQSCERGFRFIKDPLFLADSVLVKTPKRIETMVFLMGICLLVYSLGQRMLRGELQRKGGKVKNKLGKATDKPTLRWIFQILQGIHLVKINAQSHISNWLFGLCYAMDGGYKGCNPYIERHLAIFVNYFLSRAN